MAKFPPGTSNSKELPCFFGGWVKFPHCTKVADLSPKNMFGNYPPEMVPKMDLNIGDSRVWVRVDSVPNSTTPVYGLIVSVGAMPV